MTEASLFNAVSRVMVLAGIKAERDLDEPGYDAKTALEEKMAAAILKHWRAQKKAIKDQLAFWYAGRKAEISAGLIHVEDDPAFLAELINLLLTGMSGGVDLFIEGVSIGFDPTLTNIEAAKWVKKHAKELAEQIDDVTEKGLRRAISDFIETPGMTLRDVMKRLPVNEYRAKMIATTETTRAYAEGQLEAGRRMAKEIEGVRVVKRWYTNNDSIVCELCGPMNGVEVSIDEMFNTPAGPAEAPPLHPNCRCWISTGTRINVD